MMAMILMAIKEAAEAVGYQNLNHFYKYFRIQTGVTPAVYLKQGQDEVHESE